MRPRTVASARERGLRPFKPAAPACYGCWRREKGECETGRCEACVARACTPIEKKGDLRCVCIRMCVCPRTCASVLSSRVRRLSKGWWVGGTRSRSRRRRWGKRGSSACLLAVLLLRWVLLVAWEEGADGCS